MNAHVTWKKSLLIIGGIIFIFWLLYSEKTGVIIKKDIIQQISSSKSGVTTTNNYLLSLHSNGEVHIIDMLFQKDYFMAQEKKKYTIGFYNFFFVKIGVTIY